MADEIDISSIDITPEQFAELVRSTSDDQIETGIRAAGIETVLDRIFLGMQERFAPDKAAGLARRALAHVDPDIRELGEMALERLAVDVA